MASISGTNKAELKKLQREKKAQGRKTRLVKTGRVLVSLSPRRYKTEYTLYY